MSDVFRDDGFTEVLAPLDPAVIGHNSGAIVLPKPDEIRAGLRDRFRELFKRADDLLMAESRIPRDERQNLYCQDDAWEEKLTEMVRQIQGANKALDTKRMDEKQTFDDLASAVHGTFREVMDKLVDPRPRGVSALKHRVEAALTAYKAKKEAIARAKAEEAAKLRRAEEDRLRRKAEEDQRIADAAAAKLREAEEEAARKRKPQTKAAAEEAVQAAAEQAAAAQDQASGSTVLAEGASNLRSEAERAAAAPAADLTRMRSSNAVSSLQEFLDVRDIAGERLPPATLWAYVSQAEKEKAVRGYMRVHADQIKEGLKNDKQPLAGAIFFMNKRTSVR